jgi:hypothetical protein
MSYIQLRVTHSEFNADYDEVKRVLVKFADEIDATHMLGHLEKYDKFGKETKHHIHMNMYVDDDVKKDTLQKKFKKKMSAYGYNLSGLKHYSIRVLVECEDEDRWWRYILKEKNGTPFFGSGFKPEQINEWKLLAQDERKRQVESNNKALDKYLDKSSFKGKLFKYCEENCIETHREFFKTFIEYSWKEGKVPAYTKIDDYYVDYQVNVGLMTLDELYDKKYPNGGRI